MSDPTETPPPQPPASPVDNPRRRFFRRAAIATIIATLATGGWPQGLRLGPRVGGWHRGGLMGAQRDLATLIATVGGS